MRILRIIFSKLYRVMSNSHARINLELQKESGLLEVGKHTYGINNLTIHQYKGSESKVIIGKYCSLGPNILIIAGGIHPTNWISTFPFRVKFDLDDKYLDGMPQTKGPIKIGNDVWIGSNVIILSGVTIGDGAIIAAGSLVTKDVPAYSIMGGNPAKIIRYRFDKEKVKELLKISWWNWDDITILKSISILNSEKVDELLED